VNTIVPNLASMLVAEGQNYEEMDELEKRDFNILIEGTQNEEIIYKAEAGYYSVNGSSFSEYMTDLYNRDELEVDETDLSNFVTYLANTREGLEEPFYNMSAESRNSLVNNIVSLAAGETYSLNIENPQAIHHYMLTESVGEVISKQENFQDFLENHLSQNGYGTSTATTYISYLNGQLNELETPFSEMDPDDRETFYNTVASEAQGYNIYFAENSPTLTDYLHKGGAYLDVTSDKVRFSVLENILISQNQNCYILNNNLATAPTTVDLSSPTSTSTGQVYDAAYWYYKDGNLTTLHRTDEYSNQKQFTYSYTSGTNQLYEVGITGEANATYTYDGNGSLASDPKNLISDIVYDSYNNMPIRKQEFTYGETDYLYDGGGMRTAKITNGTQGYYYVGGLVVTDLSGVPVRFNIADGFVTLDGSNNLEKSYQLTDWLGTPRLGMDDQGTITTTRDYYPYGKPLPSRFYSSSFEDRRYQFTGHEYDEENNHDYHGARYYQRDIARYLGVDPLASSFPGWTPYHYTHNNPINLVDPDGRSAWKPDADGNIIAEKGDNLETLAQFLGVSQEEALEEYVAGTGDLNAARTGTISPSVGQKVLLDNPFTRNLSNHGNLPSGHFRLDYNCWGSACAGSKGEEINASKGMPSPVTFDNTLSQDYESVDYSQAKFGETILRFTTNTPYSESQFNNMASNGYLSRNPEAIGGALHGAVYYGSSSNGTVYVYTKNGWNQAPKIMPVIDLIFSIPSYGVVRGMSDDKTGYYNRQ